MKKKGKKYLLSHLLINKKARSMLRASVILLIN